MWILIVMQVCRVKNSVVDSETKRSRDCSAQRLGIHVGKSEGSDGISQAMSCIDINKWVLAFFPTLVRSWTLDQIPSKMLSNLVWSTWEFWVSDGCKRETFCLLLSRLHMTELISTILFARPALWAEVDPKLVTRTSSAVCHTPQGLSILPLDHCNMRLWHTLLPVTQPIYILPALYYPSMHFFIW